MDLSKFEFREADSEDIPRMKQIRDNVRENILVHGKIEVEDYRKALFEDGKGWVCLNQNRVIGFSCARFVQKDVWALFIDREYEGLGIGNKLMELLERWMFSQGHTEITLTTEPRTRAERLYRKRSWKEISVLPNGDIEFRLRRS